MLGVGLSLLSALLFGGMSISLAFAVRRSRDAEAGALVTSLAGFVVCAAVAAAGREWGGDLLPFLLAGLLAPGSSQLLFVLAVRESGPARASVIAGAAPLVAVTIAVIALDEPLRAPLLAGAVLIVVGGLALVAERVRPDSFRPIGLVFAFSCTVFFATRDNIVRWLATDTAVAPQLAAATTILSGTALIFLYLAVTRRERLFGDLRRAAAPFALPGPALGRLLRVALRGLLPRPGHGRQPAGRNRVAVQRPPRGAPAAPHRARRAPPRARGGARRRAAER